MQKLVKGSIFKYHNRVLKVVQTTKDLIIGAPFFGDQTSGNLEFRIPIEKLGELEICEVATKSDIKDHLKKLTNQLPAERTIFFLDKDLPLNKLTMDQAMEAIKGLADEKSLYKQNFSSNKSMRLKELVEMAAKEIGASLGTDMLTAKKMITTNIEKRLQAWLEIEKTNPSVSK
ncbi:hypothetical protein A3B57_00075 [Microgenomates group bacterium RIFCSPLOWO2_01_FULL_47_10]|nr:MAG: hypothetical protein A3B57_00075 [Microgenomates group bacterium RIFCSPLOWO2_01_FULL_47_10]